MDRRILRFPEVSRLTGLGRSRIHELEKQGKFPRRRKISDRASGWFSDEIAEWIDARPLAAQVARPAAKVRSSSATEIAA